VKDNVKFRMYKLAFGISSLIIIIEALGAGRRF
jgi:hypothetical protein